MFLWELDIWIDTNKKCIEIGIIEIGISKNIQKFSREDRVKLRYRVNFHYLRMY